MDFRDMNFRRWFIRGTVGILLTGAGVCMLIEAGFYKHTAPPTLHWVLAGTGSLIVFMAGMTIFVDSLRYRIKWEEEKRGNQ